MGDLAINPSPGIPPAGMPPDGLETSRREANKQRNRDRLYDAAIDLFALGGYVPVSVDDICTRAHVGRATFFRLYGTKSGLISEFDRRLALEARAQVAAGRPVDAIGALRIVQQVMCDAWVTSGVALREMAQEYLNTVSLGTGSRESQPDLRALVAEIIRDGQRRRELVAEPNADFVSWVVVASLSSAIATWLGSAATLQRRSEQTLDLLFTGLRHGPG